ncbi:MAG TPA: hypothetical protein VFN35_20095 [Ktedonobacteraceae bacterium]|nr:hypothetical protein [Ktedonobacteraceae bacterium]
MRKNLQALDATPSTGDQYKKSGSNLVRKRMIVCLLALLLLISALFSLTIVGNAHAQSACLILCLPTPVQHPKPTPTPIPQPSPTPMPSPRPSPTPSPTTMATPKPTPSPKVSISPTATVAATPTKVLQMPGESAVTPPPPPGPKNSGDHVGNNDMLHIAVVSGIVFLLLMLCLVFGWIFIRRALLPRPVKLPPSGASPWSRIRIPNPNSLIPAINASRSMLTRKPAFSNTTSIGNSSSHFPAATSVPGGFSSGSWAVAQTVASGNSFEFSSDERAPSFIDADATDVLEAIRQRNQTNYNNNLSDNPLSLSGGTPGKAGYFKKKKRGLIARAPYYSTLPTNEAQPPLEME